MPQQASTAQSETIIHSESSLSKLLFRDVELHIQVTQKHLFIPTIYPTYILRIIVLFIFLIL